MTRSLPSPPSSGPCTSRPPSVPPSPVQTRCHAFIPSVRHFPPYISMHSEYYHQMNQNPSYSPQERVTPAMLAAFQNQKANLFAPQSSINPSHLLQQQHNGMGISGSGSINPAALTAASPSSSSSFPQQQQHFNSMLQVVGMTREQFQSLSPQDRHTVGEKYRSVFNAHQQQQQQQQMAMINAGLANNNNNNAFSNQAQNQSFYDRPSSSASSHSQQQQSSSSRQPSSSTSHQMMPPPPPRPPTAQGGHSSRPSTSQARSPTIPGSQQGQMLEMMQQGQQRSQSRMVCFYILYSPLLFPDLTHPLFQRLIEATQ